MYRVVIGVDRVSVVTSHRISASIVDFCVLSVSYRIPLLTSAVVEIEAVVCISISLSE